MLFAVYMDMDVSVKLSSAWRVRLQVGGLELAVRLLACGYTVRRPMRGVRSGGASAERNHGLDSGLAGRPAHHAAHLLVAAKIINVLSVG